METSIAYDVNLLVLLEE